jgi:carbonic anhydrase
MSSLDWIVAANTRYVAGAAPVDLPAAPARRLAVVTCMDARIDPLACLGLQPGDAHIIRNAGGRVSEDVLRSLIISAHLLGTREVAVIHHTDCGLLGLSNDDIRQRVAPGAGRNPSGIDFLPFSDQEGSVRDDVAGIRSSPFLDPDTAVRGFIYDVRTGALSAVA